VAPSLWSTTEPAFSTAFTAGMTLVFGFASAVIGIAVADAVCRELAARE
jgi:hypothetical protein